MNTSQFHEDMAQEMKERISLSNKKKLKEVASEWLYDILWIFSDKQITTFYERAYRYNENEIKNNNGIILYL